MRILQPVALAMVSCIVCLMLACGSNSPHASVARSQYPIETSSGWTTSHKMPDGELLCWGEEPVIERSPTRGEVVLSGIWRFMPAVGAASEKPSEDWGYARVPGDWSPDWDRLTSIVHVPDSEFWKTNYVDKDDGKELQFMWFEREMAIPASWHGRAILVDLRWLSTDAKLYIDGTEVGTVDWPTGEVDITGYVTPGQRATLRIKVFAVNDRDFTWRFMGIEEQAGMVTKEKSTLHERGLLGDVILVSRPGGARVSDVFVQPSVRNKKLAAQVELSDIKHKGVIDVTARVVDDSGNVVETFEDKRGASPAARQVFTVEWSWQDPKLWEVGDPHLYTLELSAKGAGLDDVYAQRFGFREFWVDGKHMYLNGKLFRFSIMREGKSTSMAASRTRFEDLARGGWNTVQFWPAPFERGMPFYDDLKYGIADETGVGVLGRVGHLGNMLQDGAWDDPKQREQFLRVVDIIVRRSRNHPSVFAWGHSGNTFGAGQNINPRSMGREGLVADRGWKKKKAVADGLAKHLKDLDPTRFVYTHSGGEVGDIFTSNHYLNMIPLQEREQWPSHWAKHGDMPYLAVEFGVPDELTFHRNRKLFIDAKISEPWQTEFNAIYLGRDAYGDETDAYRSEVLEGYRGDGKWWDWRFRRRTDEQLNFQRLLKLFVTNTWRSWRTAGINGGMLPWSDAHGWARVGPNVKDPRPTDPRSFEERIHRIDFKPGPRGPFQSFVALDLWHPYLGKHQEVLPAGRALMENSGPTLAWIAGAPKFTDKTHHYRAGESVRKQIALINDSRTGQPFHYTVKVMVAGRQIHKDEGRGSIGVAKKQLAGLEFRLPKRSEGLKLEGEIVLQARIGQRAHKDRFPFRVFSPVEKGKGRVLVFDPAGHTNKMLQHLGYQTQAWNGKAADELVVIGRQAHSKLHSLPGSLAGHVARGGRAVVFPQHPDWLENVGYRVSKHVSRRVFPVDSEHPVTAGLDREDLRDWRGAGSLIEAYPTIGNMGPKPPWGWHWGNEHSVATGAIEKPHRSGWRPILECEFDLQYTPLMELDHGAGRVIWSQLDLEDQVVAGDPVAAIVARRLIEYARTAPVQPRSAQTVYLGEDDGRKLLASTGLEFSVSQHLPQTAELLVVGPGASVSDKDIQHFARQGGEVLVLARDAGEAPLGVRLERSGDYPERNWEDPRDRWSSAQLKALFWGSVDVPGWPQTRGLSVSETRFKTFHPWARLVDGAEIAAGGMLARKRIGEGVILYAQFDPTRFDVDRRPFFRFTRWRHTRALSQLLANLGGTFSSDAASLDPELNAVSLGGTWRGKVVKPLKPADGWDNRRPPQAISDEARALVGKINDARWQKVQIPDDWNSYGGEWVNIDGEAIFRREVILPASWEGQDLVLDLGQSKKERVTIDDQDDTFWNGERVGGQDDYWDDRLYPVPGRLVRGGPNMLAIRVFDRLDRAGIYTAADMLKVRLKDSDSVPELYHPDYRSAADDWNDSDEPYRWNMW